MTINSNLGQEVYKVLSTPEAEHLAELYLLQRDLKTAYQTLELYFKKYSPTETPKEGNAALISPSLFRDGILLFCACFSTKDPSKLDPHAVYASMGQDKLDYAQTLLNVRDAFVAHNFGPQRQSSIVIVCAKIDAQIAPIGFTQYYVRFAGWVESERETLLPFIEVAREHLNQLIEAAEVPVTRQVMDLAQAGLESLPDAVVTIPHAADYRTSRSRFRESGRGSRTSVPQRRLGRTIVVASEPRR